jgi:hypothetical protein
MDSLTEDLVDGVDQEATEAAGGAAVAAEGVGIGPAMAATGGIHI